MSLFNEEGELDTVEARRKLKTIGQLRNEGNARQLLATITAAALLDIAESLRPMGTESAIALNQTIDFVGQPDGDEPDDEPAVVTLSPIDAVAGTLVALKSNGKTGYLDGVDGLDQGEPWVGVHWYGENEASVARTYVQHIEVVTNAEGKPVTLDDLSEAGVVLEGDPAVDALLEEIADRPEVSEGYDDPTVPDTTVDEDFDNALEALEAKSPKKKAKKK